MGTAYTDLYSKLVTELPRCPAPLMLETIREVSIEFFKETLAWPVELTLSLVEDQADYDLSADGEMPLQTVLHGVREVKINDAPQTPGEDYNYTMDKDKINLHLEQTPTEDDDDALWVEVAVRPSSSATGLVNDRLYDDYCWAIAKGVKARLMAMSKQPWSNPRDAAMYHEMYWEDIRKAKIEQSKERMLVDQVAYSSRSFI